MLLDEATLGSRRTQSAFVIWALWPLGYWSHIAKAKREGTPLYLYISFVVYKLLSPHINYFELHTGPVLLAWELLYPLAVSRPCLPVRRREISLSGMTQLWRCSDPGHNCEISGAPWRIPSSVVSGIPWGLLSGVQQLGFMYFTTGT